jgi:peptide/nickel transport system substrate-binding protein
MTLQRLQVSLATLNVSSHFASARSFDVARRSAVMDRRTFIKAAAGAGVLTAAGALATPAIPQRAAARVLRFVPQADLANFDPIWNTQYVVRNGAALVWDMLYGVDDKLQPRRQMVESEDVSSEKE